MDEAFASVAWIAQTPDVARRAYAASKPRCRLCNQTRSDYQKNLNRPLRKARNTISKHAGRYAKRWKCSLVEARRRLTMYGWTPEAIARLFRDAMAVGTCECTWAWDFGEHEMTLDVNDPSALPLMSNLSVICRACNVRKRDMTLPEWRQFNAYCATVRAGEVVMQLGFADDW